MDIEFSPDKLKKLQEDESGKAFGAVKSSILAGAVKLFTEKYFLLSKIPELNLKQIPSDGDTEGKKAIKEDIKRITWEVINGAEGQTERGFYTDTSKMQFVKLSDVDKLLANNVEIKDYLNKEGNGASKLSELLPNAKQLDMIAGAVRDAVHQQLKPVNFAATATFAGTASVAQQGFNTVKGIFTGATNNNDDVKKASMDDVQKALAAKMSESAKRNLNELAKNQDLKFMLSGKRISQVGEEVYNRASAIDISTSAATQMDQAPALAPAPQTPVVSTTAIPAATTTEQKISSPATGETKTDSSTKVNSQGTTSSTKARQEVNNGQKTGQDDGRQKKTKPPSKPTIKTDHTHPETVEHTTHTNLTETRPGIQHKGPVVTIETRPISGQQARTDHIQRNIKPATAHIAPVVENNITTNELPIIQAINAAIAAVGTTVLLKEQPATATLTPAPQPKSTTTIVTAQDQPVVTISASNPPPAQSNTPATVTTVEQPAAVTPPAPAPQPKSTTTIVTAQDQPVVTISASNPPPAQSNTPATVTTVEQPAAVTPPAIATKATPPASAASTNSPASNNVMPDIPDFDGPKATPADIAIVRAKAKEDIHKVVLEQTEAKIAEGIEAEKEKIRNEGGFKGFLFKLLDFIGTMFGGMFKGISDWITGFFTPSKNDITAASQQVATTVSETLTEKDFKHNGKSVQELSPTELQEAIQKQVIGSLRKNQNNYSGFNDENLEKIAKGAGEAMADPKNFAKLKEIPSEIYAQGQGEADSKLSQLTPKNGNVQLAYIPMERPPEQFTPISGCTNQGVSSVVGSSR